MIKDSTLIVNPLTDIDRNHLIDILTEELPVLRAKLGLSQEELNDIIGISRQTYSSIETKKRKMTWGTFLSFILFFDHNEKTKPILRVIGAFPDSLKELLNTSNRD